MRKNILSLSIAAMCGGWNLPKAVAQGPWSTATDLLVTPEGIVLQVPHYTSTHHDIPPLLVITPEPQGKVVKVRFRGASSSEDVFDFNLFLAPGDVWKGNHFLKGKANG